MMMRVHVQYYFRGAEIAQVLLHNSTNWEDVRILLANELWCDPMEIKIFNVWSE